jgi:hypothetical protein
VLGVLAPFSLLPYPNVFGVLVLVGVLALLFFQLLPHPYVFGVRLLGGLLILMLWILILWGRVILKNAHLV